MSLHFWTGAALLAQFLIVSAQNGDGGASTGYGNSNLGSAGSGADGSSSSSANLSKGAIIAIAVVVAAVVIGGATLAILFYVAKKRSWKVRQTIRYTTSKVVRAMTPRTPHFNFPRSPRPDAQPRDFSAARQRNESRNRDVEKGFVPIEERVSSSSEDKTRSKQAGHDRKPSDVNKKLPKPKPTIDVPRSEYELESPLKSPMWQRILGRS